MCATDADCKAGSCVPLALDGRDTGYCRIRTSK